MKVISLFALVVLSACSAVPIILEEVIEGIEIEQDIMREIHHNEDTVLCLLEPWKYEVKEKSEDEEEKFRERMKNYSDYYHYHFNKYLV